MAELPDHFKYGGAIYCPNHSLMSFTLATVLYNGQWMCEQCLPVDEPENHIEENFWDDRTTPLADG